MLLSPLRHIEFLLVDYFSPLRLQACPCCGLSRLRLCLQSRTTSSFTGASSRCSCYGCASATPAHGPQFPHGCCACNNPSSGVVPASPLFLERSAANAGSYAFVRCDRIHSRTRGSYYGYAREQPARGARLYSGCARGLAPQIWNERGGGSRLFC